MKKFKKIFFLFSSSEYKKMVSLLIMIVIMALLDMIGVASILPFVAVLTNPNLIDTNVFLNFMFQSSSIFGIENKKDFFFFLGILVFLLLIFSLAFKAITNFIQVQFLQRFEYNVCRRLMAGYLRQPYSWFLNRNSAELGKNILTEVGQLVERGLGPLIELIAKGIVAITLIILLLIVDIKLALLVFSFLGGSYCFIFFVLRNYLKLIGEKRLKNNQLRFKILNEIFGAIKQIKFGNLEKQYTKKFSKYAKIFAVTQASSSIIRQLPRFILEAIAFGGILLMMLYMMRKTGSFNNALPTISLYVFAGYRLMPALQQIYSSFTQLTFIEPSLNKLYEDIKSTEQIRETQHEEIITFNKEIVLKNINYNYPNKEKVALKDINLTIPAKSKIGLIGKTGSGKTTLVDIILGLLTAQTGSLEVDGKVINKHNLKSWQNSIGYVPQQVYLFDDTIEKNIAFGVESDEIDHDLIEKVSKISNIHEFIINELTEKYQTFIGERGVRLSGGQLQRIGIARALYHKPKILILDEATSSLDNETEKAVIDAINNLEQEITIISIAHRLNTVKNCEMIFLLEKGVIKKRGTLKKLTNMNEIF